MSYIPLPLSYGNILADANRTFLDGGEVYMPKLRFEFPTDTKAFIKLTVTLGHTYSANIYFEAYYRRSGIDGWTKVADFKGTATNRTETQYIPVDGVSATKPMGAWIQFGFRAKTNSTTTTPVLNSYDCRALLYPSRRDIIRCVVRCADDQYDRLGQRLEDQYTNIKVALEEAKNSATWPVTLYDPFYAGTAKYVKFLPVQPFEQIVKWEKGKNPEIHFNLLLQEVSLS